MSAMMNHRLIIAMLLAMGVGAGLALQAKDDSLLALKDGKLLQTFEELWSDYDPRTEPLETEILKEWEEDGVVLKVLRYRIGIFKGQKAMMAAVYGYPKGGTKLPGLLQIHGGGQYADYKAPLTNAKRGYATLSIAWAGRISAPEYAVNPDIVQLFWDNKPDDPKYKVTTDWGVLDAYHAPCRNAKNHFANVAPQPWTLDAVESPRNNPWFLCTLGARRGLTFLEQQPEVDRERLGVYGHSMGGKLTIMTTAADSRIKASAPSCGGISNRNTDNPLYNATIADDVNLKRISCPIIFLSPANDFHGRIDDLQKAHDEIKSKAWRVTCSPHHNHQDTEPFQVAGPLWFDQFLKGSFTYPQTPQAVMTLKTKNGVPAFTVTPDASKPILSVDIFYTQQGQKEGEKNDHENTMARFWHHAVANQKGNVWTAALPVLSTDKPLWVYANVLYPLKEPVTGAGYYYGLYTATQFNVSSRMLIATPEQLKAAGVQATDKPSPVIETFKTDWQKEWFTYDLKGDWPRNTHKLYDPKWKAPADAKLAVDIRSEQPNKMVFGLDEYAAEVPLNGGREWQSVVLVPGDFSNGEEVKLARWGGVRELRLGYKESLRRKANDTNCPPGKDRILGGIWNGPAPAFRNLRWVVGENTGSPTSPGKPALQRGNALVTGHGAKADGITLNTRPIQAAIDACSQAGGGTVTIPAGRFVTGTIRMKDNVTLYLEKGAVLLGSTNLADYATDVVGAVEAPAFNRCLIFAHQATNIGFSGEGLVDARGTPQAFPERVGKGLGERPMLMRLVECRDVNFTDVSFKNSASWGLHLVSCRDVAFDGIRIDSQNNNINNDGIDLDSCFNVLIENCVINSGDDAICLKSTTLQPCSNIVVRGCTVSSHTAAYKLGTSSRGGFIDVKVENCRFHDCPMGAIKLLMVDGGRLENVEISNITMENVGGPIFIRLGNRGRVYDKPTEQVYGQGVSPEGAPVGVLRNVRIRDIRATVTGNERDRQGIMITGIPGHRIEDVVLENIKITLPGGGTAAEAARVVPEDVARYPEQFFFGVLPSSVLYARHVKGLSLKNISMTLEKEDARPAIITDDAEAVRLVNVTLDGKLYEANAPEASRAQMLRQPYYSYACWLNGWRRNRSDTTQAIFAIETSHYAFSLNPADFSKAGFAFHDKPGVGYAQALHSGTDPLHQLPTAELIIELEADGNPYRAVTCKAGTGTDARRLSAARMWESGRLVQHYDFLGLDLLDARGKALSCTGTLDLVAWPDSLTLTASLVPVSPAWSNATLRVQFKGNGIDRKIEKQFAGTWAAGEEKSVTLKVPSPQRVSPDANVSVHVTAGAEQRFPVTFDPRKDCFVASVPTIKRSFAAGYTDIRDYDEFAVTVDNQGRVGRDVPFLLDFRSPANITGLCPILCDKEGRPTGIPVQLSKNWHHPKTGAYLMAYSSLPAKPEKTEYLLRIAYGFYGTLPSASHSQLSLIGYGEGYGNGRWDQLAIGCWGETICFDMDMSLVDVAITDVRLLMTRNGREGKMWGWTDAGWGGDWLGMWNASGDKLAFNDLKTAYLSQGPCLTDVRYAGFYGADREVSLEAQVQTLRTDDYARTFQKLKYTFNVDAKTDLLWFYKMGRTSNHITPLIAYGNRAGLIAEQKVPFALKPKTVFVDKLALESDGPWWVAFPGATHIGRDWGTGYRALIIRSYQAILGGKTFSNPTISMPVNQIQKDGKGLDLDLLLVAPKEVSGFRPGDTVEMDLEWITLPRIADDYYGPNETFRTHLAENPSSWKTTYREAFGNDLDVTVKGGKVLNRYPVIIRSDKPTVTVVIKGGIGYVPIRFEGLASIKDAVLSEVVGGKEIRLDQSVHGNDFWQADYEDGSRTYTLTYNLPLDNKPISTWRLTTK